MLTQRSVDAQQFGADSVNATVEKSPCRRETSQRYVTPYRTATARRFLFLRKRLTVQEPHSVRQKRILMPYCCRRSQPPAPSAAWMRWWRSVRQSKRILPLTKLHLEMATVRAPFDGTGSFPSKPPSGNLLLPCALFFTLIDTRHWYVIANFRETDLKKYSLRYTRNHSPDERQRQNLRG